MILLITSSNAGYKCSEELAQATGKQVELVADLGVAARRLNEQQCELVVLDQVLVDYDAAAVEALFSGATLTVPVFVNLAICGTERLATEVKAALMRARQQRIRATKAAGAELRDELRGAVTGILLSSELALGVPALPAAAECKLAQVVELAQRMRRSLEM